MTESYIAHRSPDGSRLFAVLSLSILKSLDYEKINALNSIGIKNVSDLLHYAPVYRARLIVSVANGLIAHDMDLRMLLADNSLPNDPKTLVEANTEIIDGIGISTARMLAEKFNVINVNDLSKFTPYLEAETLLRHDEESFTEASSAPDELIPRTIGAVASNIRFSSLIVDEIIKFDSSLINSTRQNQLLGSIISWEKLSLGYVALHNQKWINLGVHLGEITLGYFKIWYFR